MTIPFKHVRRKDYLAFFGFNPNFRVGVNFEQDEDNVGFTATYVLYQDRCVPSFSEQEALKEFDKGVEHFNYVFNSVYKKMLNEKSKIRCLFSKDYAKKIKWLEENITLIEEDMTSKDNMKKHFEDLKEKRDLFLNETIKVPDLDLKVGDFAWAVTINQALNIHNTDECQALTLYKYEVIKVSIMDGKFQGADLIPHYTLRRINENDEDYAYKEIDFTLNSNITEERFKINQRYNKLKIFLDEAEAKSEYDIIRKNIIERI